MNFKKSKNQNTFSIGIVGFGPKGLYAFERLLAEIQAQNIEIPVIIHLFNRSKFFGSGDVYRSDQPEYLKMNFPNEFISMWPEKKPSAVVTSCFSFSSWLAIKSDVGETKISKMYASRKIVGLYLEEGFQKLIENKPRNVEIFKHVAEVQDIEKLSQQFKIRCKSKDKEVSAVFFAHSILFTTGHQKKEQVAKLPNFVPYIYPLPKAFKLIAPRKSVGIKGMGLTFVDAVLALTEGRQGQFYQENLTLQYKESGGEPRKIYPFSNSGFLMIPRTSEAISTSRNISYLEIFLEKEKKSCKKYSFREELLPEIEKDYAFAYYQRLFEQHHKTLKYFSTYDEVAFQIDQFHQNYPHLKRFELQDLFFPIPADTKNWHGATVNYLSFLAEELRAPDKSPIIAASATWRNLSSQFNKIYSQGGLDAKSHEEFDRYFSGKLNRISYGPPLQNMLKVLCLAKKGLIDFSQAKNPEISKQNGTYTLNLGNNRVDCDYLVDARIPKIDVEKDLLYQNLCKRGLARIYKNSDTSKKMNYIPGNIDLNEKGYFFDKNGRLNQNLSAYGTPTEGLTYDNDTLSRSRNDFASFWAKKTVKKMKAFKLNDKEYKN